MVDGFNPTAFALVMGGWLLFVCLHEYSHALVAYIGGDKSVKNKGYLTFNFFKYIHPQFTIIYPTIIMLIVGIGFPGAAVNINKGALRNKYWGAAVSLAGPISGMIVLALLLIPIQNGMADLSGQNEFWTAYAFLCFLQLTATIMNLIPIPPLDGFGAFSTFMPVAIKNTLNRYWSYFFFGLFISLGFVQPIRDAFWGWVYGIIRNFGVPPELTYQGFQMIRLSIFGN